WPANGTTTHSAAVPPRAPRNSRRLIATPEAQDRASYRLKTSTSEGAMSALGQKQTFFRCETYVRFTPESGHWQGTSACRLWANSGLMQRSKQHRCSITSSATVDEKALR